MLVEPTLSILQYNVNKSRDKVMIPLFEQQNTLLYDILAIQEPWKNSFQNTTNHRLSQYFELAYLPDRNTRLALSAWTVTHHSNDFLTLRLQTVNDRVIYIHNYITHAGAAQIPVHYLY